MPDYDPQQAVKDIQAQATLLKHFIKTTDPIGKKQFIKAIQSYAECGANKSDLFNLTDGFARLGNMLGEYIRASIDKGTALNVMPTVLGFSLADDDMKDFNALFRDIKIQTIGDLKHRIRGARELKGANILNKLIHNVDNPYQKRFQQFMLFYYIIKDLTAEDLEITDKTEQATFSQRKNRCCILLKQAARANLMHYATRQANMRNAYSLGVVLLTTGLVGVSVTGIFVGLGMLTLPLSLTTLVIAAALTATLGFITAGFCLSRAINHGKAARQVYAYDQSLTLPHEDKARINNLNAKTLSTTQNTFAPIVNEVMLMRANKQVYFNNNLINGKEFSDLLRRLQNPRLLGSQPVDTLYSLLKEACHKIQNPQIDFDAVIQARTDYEQDINKVLLVKALIVEMATQNVLTYHDGQSLGQANLCTMLENCDRMITWLAENKHNVMHSFDAKALKPSTRQPRSLGQLPKPTKKSVADLSQYQKSPAAKGDKAQDGTLPEHSNVNDLNGTITQDFVTPSRNCFIATPT